MELTARLGECEEELKAKEQAVEQVISDCQAVLRAKTADCEKNQAMIAHLHEQLGEKTVECESQFTEHESVIEQLRQELRAKQEQLESKTAECERMVEQLQKEPSNKQEQPKAPESSSQQTRSKLLLVNYKLYDYGSLNFFLRGVA